MVPRLIAVFVFAISLGSNLNRGCGPKCGSEAYGENEIHKSLGTRAQAYSNSEIHKSLGRRMNVAVAAQAYSKNEIHKSLGERSQAYGNFEIHKSLGT